MLKYCFITDEEKGLVQLGVGCPDEYYIEIGMQKRDVKQSDIDFQWYLSEKCPMKTEEEKFNEAKTNKYNENTFKAKEAIENGYVLFKDAQFETNTQTCSDLTSTMLIMQASGLETYSWLSKDDKVVVLTLEDFSTLGGLIAQAKNSVWNVKYLNYKTQIDNATTLEEVGAIEINYDSNLGEQ